MHRGQAGSQLWAKVEAARVKCARNAPSSCQPASSLSVGWEGWLGMQCYIHLLRPRSADLTLPEELGPYLCKWLPWWSRADSSTSPILHTKGHSTTDKREAAPLFFLPRALLATRTRHISDRLFPDIEPKHMAYVCIKANRQDKIKGSNIVRNFIQVDRRMPLRGLLVKLE